MTIKNICVEELLELNKNHNVRLVDIRGADKHAREKIEGAENITIEQLKSENFKSDDIVVFHCQSGNRTRHAEHIFKTLGLDVVYVLNCGLNGWKKASQKVKVNKKAPLPLMRQVQMIVGFMVVLGAVLAVTVCSHFAFISMFFGAGLLFAGISGRCGLARVLMILPYNKNNKT